MKQHITKDQVGELDEKQMGELLKYMSHKDYLPQGAQMMLHDSGYYLAQFLTIGQMIEYLNDKDAWPSSIEDYPGNPYYGDSDELCDNLWCAVKKTLSE